ncbi:MAG: 2-succinyl-6-hydroxy-2,4-cyclohexadiene-1-carboxylate synthase [Bacilli bacterium]
MASVDFRRLFGSVAGVSGYRSLIVNGVSLRIWQNRDVSAELPTVLFLHGFAGCADDFSSVFPALDKYAIVAVDLLGHGGSDAPTDSARYQMAGMVLDLHGLLFALGVRQTHVVGYSMGGRIALALAAARPGLVRSLVLESASPGLSSELERAQRRRSDDALAGWIEAEGIERFVNFWEANPLFASQASLDQDTRMRQRMVRMAQRPHGLGGSLRGHGTGVQPSLWGRLPSVRAPVLAVSGEFDAKFTRIGSSMVRLLPHAAHVVVQGAGHNIHLERPTEFAALAAQFLEAHEHSGQHGDPQGAPSDASLLRQDPFMDSE